MAITNPYQTDPQKQCEDSKCEGGNNKATALYIRNTKIIRLCDGCVSVNDEPLNKRDRFERHRLLPDHNRK